MGNRSELLERFAANPDDLCVFGTVPGDLAAEQVTLAENPIEVLAVPGHPWAGHARLTLADIAAQPMIMREPGSGTRRAAEAQLEAAGLEPNVRFELGAN